MVLMFVLLAIFLHWLIVERAKERVRKEAREWHEKAMVSMLRAGYLPFLLNDNEYWWRGNSAPRLVTRKEKHER